MNTLPDEVKENNGWSYDFKFLHELTDKVNEREWGEGLSMEQVEAVLLEIKYAKAYAPVPGKEEVKMILEKAQDEIDRLHYGYSPEGHKGKSNNVYNEIHKFIVNHCLSASPSTASNEDKKMGVAEAFAELRKLGSAWDNIICVCRGLIKDDPCELNCKEFNDESLSNERNTKPKAVQQAAKEYATHIVKGPKPWEQFDRIKYDAFLAGASFNSDAVEFLNWVFENGYVYNTEDGYLWLNDVPYLVDETYSVFKQNNIQQAHDKAQYE